MAGQVRVAIFSPLWLVAFLLGAAHDTYSSPTTGGGGTLDGRNSLGTPAAPTVSVGVVTWNLAQSSPPAADVEAVCKVVAESEVAAICLQEVEDLKPRSKEGRRSRFLRRALIGEMGKLGHSPVVCGRLGGIQQLVFVHDSARVAIDGDSVVTWEVACGIGNVLHNKGAVGVRLVIHGVSCMLLGAHLAAHEKHVAQRNADYDRVRRETAHALQAAASDIDLSLRDPASEDVDLRSLADVVVFAGDLNYRLELPRDEVQLALTSAESTESYDSMLEYDQLIQARASGAAFSGFREGVIRFGPTFKFNKGQGVYDTSAKRRIPSWTDRVLFTSQHPGHVVLDRYESLEAVTHGDHRPVYAALKIAAAQKKE
uniref:Inositol polyphosphate-related phosphatase domain-containing protein n=1 Tax=Rhizochromulina marina TaxID=1034831 RepID=A0A7S2WGS3_9STRA